MLELVPNDILLYVIEFLFPRDKISIRLTCNKFKNIVKFYEKIDSEYLDITIITEKIVSRKRCEICGIIFVKPTDLMTHILNKHIDYWERPTYKVLLRYRLQVTTCVPYYFYLLSLSDLDCSSGKCNCPSRGYLLHPFIGNDTKTHFLTTVGFGRRKYYLYTDYGIVSMDTRMYLKKTEIQTECVTYVPNTVTNDRDLCRSKYPKILQSQTHHWLILNYSNYIVPIKNIVILGGIC